MGSEIINRNQGRNYNVCTETFNLLHTLRFKNIMHVVLTSQSIGLQQTYINLSPSQTAPSSLVPTSKGQTHVKHATDFFSYILI